MIIEIKIPSAGESITEVAIGTWLAEDGAYVQRDQEIAEVESDKATLPLITTESGTLHIIAQAGQKVQVGDTACTIDTSSMQEAPVKKTSPTKKPVVVLPEKVQPEVQKSIKATPLAQSMMKHHHLDVDGVLQGLRKLNKQDVEAVLSKPAQQETSNFVFAGAAGRPVDKVPMSPLRRKLSKRLVAVKNETAMLTTFNEVDMSSVLEIRKKYQEAFTQKHGQKLGLMSFFAKACSEALLLFPRVNSVIEGDNILSPRFVDIAVAVQTDKGLMVPVIRDTQSMTLAMLENAIGVMAEKARNARLSIEEMTGGTFTITNGGVFGSMLSTPILNPPQSAILGMHNIVQRPVAIDGMVVIRPIMYIALSYDHRIIDGRDSVSFLLKVRELIETPAKMAMEGVDPEKVLLGL